MATAHKNNKHTRRVLFQVLDANQWTQHDLARRAKIARSVAGAHLTGERPIRVAHLRQYLSAVKSPDRRRLIRAWLRDHLRPGAALIALLAMLGLTLSVICMKLR